jgi:hypothetical protein
LSLPEVSMKQLDRQPAIEMNIFAAAEEGCMASKD